MCFHHLESGELPSSRSKTRFDSTEISTTTSLAAAAAVLFYFADQAAAGAVKVICTVHKQYVPFVQLPLFSSTTAAAAVECLYSCKS